MWQWLDKEDMIQSYPVAIGHAELLLSFKLNKVHVVLNCIVNWGGLGTNDKGYRENALIYLLAF